MIRIFFFFKDTATTEIYTLSLHDALPIWHGVRRGLHPGLPARVHPRKPARGPPARGRPLRHGRRQPGSLERARAARRSEEHTSELQSRQYLVCRLLLEKKKTKHDDIRRVE